MAEKKKVVEEEPVTVPLRTEAEIDAENEAVRKRAKAVAEAKRSGTPLDDA